MDGRDEFDDFMAEQMRDPEFRAAYARHLTERDGYVPPVKAPPVCVLALILSPYLVIAGVAVWWFNFR